MAREGKGRANKCSNWVSSRFHRVQVLEQAPVELVRSEGITHTSTTGYMEADSQPADSRKVEREHGGSAGLPVQEHQVVCVVDDMEGGRRQHWPKVRVSVGGRDKLKGVGGGKYMKTKECGGSSVESLETLPPNHTNRECQSRAG